MILLRDPIWQGVGVIVSIALTITALLIERRKISSRLITVLAISLVFFSAIIIGIFTNLATDTLTKGVDYFFWIGGVVIAILTNVLSAYFFGVREEAQKKAAMKKMREREKDFFSQIEKDYPAKGEK